MPPGWRKLRKAVLDRDGWACKWLVGGRFCGAPANEVDHIFDPNCHDPAGLRAICTYHHRKRTSKQAHEARRAKYSTNRVERHPGLR